MIMKKHLFYVLCMALTAMTFQACGSDDPEPSNQPPKLNTVTNAEQAALYNIQDAKSPVKFVEFTETGLAVIQMVKDAPEVKTRGVAEILDYIVGTYKWDGKEYEVLVGGKTFCWFSIGNLSNGKYSISIRFPGEDPIEVKGSIGAKASATNLTSDMCRSWVIDETRIRHEGKVTGAKEFKGCNMNDILAYAKKMANITEEFEPNKVVTNIVFTRSGSFYIFYANGDDDFGTWKWKNEKEGILTYQWRDESMGSEFESGEATFDVRRGKYCLTLTADIDDDGHKAEPGKKGSYNVSLSFYMSEK